MGRNPAPLDTLAAIAFYCQAQKPVHSPYREIAQRGYRVPETEKHRPIEVERFDSIDSTSDHARRLIESGEFGGGPRLFVASEQSGGKGRFGRSWASPPGGLWITLAWPVSANVGRVLDGLGLRVGLAMLHSIDHALAAHGHDSDVRIKWPNDVLIRGRKVAGALCETLRRDATTYVLVGVGVNGNFPVGALPESLRTSATTLMDEIGARVNLDRLLNDLTERLEEALTTHGVTEHRVSEIEGRLYGLGQMRDVTLPDGSTVRGQLLGLTPDGRLRMGTEAGERVLPSGAEFSPSG